MVAGLGDDSGKAGRGGGSRVGAVALDEGGGQEAALVAFRRTMAPAR